MRHYLNLCPSGEGVVSVRLTGRTWLALMGDYTHYRNSSAQESGSHERMLGIIQWRLPARWFPPWVEPFGQLGLGIGSMAYSGVLSDERVSGPASRLGIGARLYAGEHVFFVPTLSFDRLDAAANQVDRKYPTMFTFRCALGLRVLGGRSLLTDDH
jgi:hypothetical protein